MSGIEHIGAAIRTGQHDGKNRFGAAGSCGGPHMCMGVRAMACHAGNKPGMNDSFTDRVAVTHLHQQFFEHATTPRCLFFIRNIVLMVDGLTYNGRLDIFCSICDLVDGPGAVPESRHGLIFNPYRFHVNIVSNN